MALGHLGQLNGMHCESRMLKFLYKYMLLSGNIFVCHYVISFQTRILNSIAVGIFPWSIQGILRPVAFSVILCCHPFEDMIALRKQEFLKSVSE